MMKDILLTKPEIVDYSKSVHRILKGKVKKYGRFSLTFLFFCENVINGRFSYN